MITEKIYALIDDLTVTNLTEMRDDFVENLRQEMPFIFSDDPKEDKKIIRKKIKAFNEVIEYLTQ